MNSSLRLVYVSGILGGVASMLLFFAIILYRVDDIRQYTLYLYLASASITGVVTVASVFNSLTQRVFVHPDDKLVGNMFAYILFIAHILTIGHFFGDDFPQTERFSYDAGVLILTVFIFVYLVLMLGNRLGFHKMLKDDKLVRHKEVVSRFVLFSVLLGLVVLVLKFLFDTLYITVNSYEWSVFIIFLSTVGVMVLIGVLTWKKYEPVDEEQVSAMT